MKRLIILLFLCGCSTSVPVKRTFPDPPNDLVYAPALDSLSYGSKMSDLLKNSTQNYSRYYITKAKYDAWVKWYIEQKSLYK